MSIAIVSFGAGVSFALLILVAGRYIEDGRTARNMEKQFRAAAIRHAAEQNENGVA